MYRDAISAVFHHGARTVLNTEWQDKNVICPNSKIYYVIDGELVVEVMGKTLIAKCGDAIVIPSGIKHSYHLTSLGYAEKYWFHFDLRLGQNNFFYYTDIPFIKHLGLREELCELCETIVNKDEETPEKMLLKSSAILSVISVYMKDASYILTEPNNKDETDEVIDFIKKNYFERFTLEALASMANLAPNYFAKKFKEKTGHPPLKYINILRVEKAKFLLEYSDDPINKIMEIVGFGDFAHFTKLFKKETGYSPTKYRNALKKRIV